MNIIRKMSSLLAILPFLFVQAFAQKSNQDYSVEQVFKSDTLFKVPESIFYHKEKNILFVSNINGKPSEKDGNGFISTVSTDGQIQKLEWLAGLDAPKGMGAIGNILYVTNITELVEIDIEKQAIINRYDFPGSKFLNDIDTDPKTGTVYVSDMGDNKVYAFANGKQQALALKDSLQRPNGLLFHNNKLYIGVSGAIYEYNPSSGKGKFVVSNTGGIDGLELVNEKSFLISDWAGKIQIVGKKACVLSDTSADKINAADIDYIPHLQLIAVPNFFANTITLFKLKAK